MEPRPVASEDGRRGPGDDAAPEAESLSHAAMLDAVVTTALNLGAQGTPVFPCDARNKRPLVDNGFKAATTDRSIVATWWKRWPAAMIGVPTGRSSGVFVLDVDRDVNKGLDGFVTLAALEAAHRPLPETRTQRTPRGGEHRLFSWPGVAVSNSASKLGPGLDVRGDGGYFIVAPSFNADGVRYEWIREVEPAPAPAWLFALMDQRPSSGPSSGTIASPTKGSRAAYAEAALAAERGTVAQAAVGQRNAALNRSASALGQLVGGGMLGHDTVETVLADAAAASRLVADDGEASVRRTIKSGLDAGMAQPRSIPASLLSTGRRPGRASEAARSGPSTFDRTEDGIALAFAEKHGQNLRYCHHAGRWYVWTGTHWQKEETRLAFNWARDVCRDINATADQKLSKASTVAAVERFAQADRAFAVTSTIWDPDPFLLGTPAGAVDLRTGILRPAKRTDFLTRQTAVAPHPGAEHPLWTRFLDEATLHDAGLQRFMQQVAGYCLTGDVREHALFFLCGPGGNGKTLFLNVLAGLMGDYATTAAMDTFTASSTDRHPTDLAMLQGARLVSASETEEGRAWAESRIKQMTGGEPIRARYMRQDYFQYRPQFKLVIVGNHKPVLRNVDEAARRRFNIIPFIHKPPEPDRQLEAKLKQEWLGILAWAIRGCIDWQENGLVRPAVVADATSAYFSEQDSLRLWEQECCETGGRSLSDTTAALFASWSAYAMENGEKPGTTKWFSQALARHGYEQVAETPGHRKKRGFLGIAVKTVDTSDQWQNRLEEH